MQTLKVRLCTYPNCLMLGRWKPSVQVRTPDNDRTFRFDFQNCRVCDNHKNILTLEDIIGGKVFAQLIGMFKEKFIHPPKKEDCTLLWENSTIQAFVKDKLINEIPLNRN